MAFEDSSDAEGAVSNLNYKHFELIVTWIGKGQQLELELMANDGDMQDTIARLYANMTPTGKKKTMSRISLSGTQLKAEDTSSIDNLKAEKGPDLHTYVYVPETKLPIFSGLKSCDSLEI